MISSPEAPVEVTTPETNPVMGEPSTVTDKTPEIPKTPENGKSLMDSLKSFLGGFRKPKVPEVPKKPDRSAEAPYKVPKSPEVAEREMAQFQANQPQNI